MNVVVRGRERIVKRGYYVGLRDPRDPNRVHSTFFLEWVPPNPGENDEPGEPGRECDATFRAIGGNQGREPGMVTVTGRPPTNRHFIICNGMRDSCNCYDSQVCGSDNNCYVWSDNPERTTFFGKTWHPSKNCSGGGVK